MGTNDSRYDSEDWRELLENEPERWNHDKEIPIIRKQYKPEEQLLRLKQLRDAYKMFRDEAFKSGTESVNARRTKNIATVDHLIQNWEEGIVAVELAISEVKKSIEDNKKSTKGTRKNLRYQDCISRIETFRDILLNRHV